MTTEAVTKYPDSELHIYSLATARSSGEVVQLPDGRAGVKAGLNGGGVGDAAAFYTRGIFKVQKTASIVLLAGQVAGFVTSTNKATYALAGNFKLGTVVEDAAAADETVLIDFNVYPQANLIEQGKGSWTAGATLGLGVTTTGGESVLAFDAVAEVAMAALYSAALAGVTADPIFEAEVAIYNIGDDASLDISFGLANATHASDTDAITESVLFHLDGSSLNINAESDDGTTEVAATDTTVDAVDDTYALYQIDARDPADVKLYINGLQVLSGSTFVLTNATGPLLALFHIEKTSNDTVADVRVRNARVYLSPTP